MIAKFRQVFGEGNPQLIRELKGKLQPVNVAIAVAVSLCSQFLVYLFFQNLIPKSPNSLEKFHRYCQGKAPDFISYRSFQHCTPDALGSLTINWQLWWLDIFICTSIIGIFVLLVGGTYLLIRDLSQEESRGTLEFIRLCPQPAMEILTGKILGVPILLYLLCALGLPFNFYAAWQGGISPLLTASFYGTLVISSIFFYSVALLFALVSKQSAAFSPWIGSGTVCAFLAIITFLNFGHLYEFQLSTINRTPFDWLIVFYPGILLPHLVEATSIADHYYLNIVLDFTELKWYGMPFWSNMGTTTAFVLANYFLWTNWLWQGLKRRFHNPSSTLITKGQSYWLSGSFIVTIIGFVPQQPEFGNYQDALFENFGFVIGLTLILFLTLIPALSPQRQTLQDWARYRYDSKYDRWSLWKDLVWGEKSPATVAIALNLFTASAVILPGILMLPLQQYKLPVFFGMLFTASLILLYACIFQLAVLMKRPQHGVWLAMAVFVSTILPFMSWWLLQLNPHNVPGFGFFTFIPTTAIGYAQTTTLSFSIFLPWLTIALVSWQTKRQLQKAGESETKTLLGS